MVGYASLQCCVSHFLLVKSCFKSLKCFLFEKKTQLLNAGYFYMVCSEQFPVDINQAIPLNLRRREVNVLIVGGHSSEFFLAKHYF